MSKRAAAFYGLLFGAITMSVLSNGLWFAAILAALSAIPTFVRRIRARRSASV